MRRLDRYVLNETLGPLGLGFLVYTFILLLKFLFQSAEMIIRRGLPSSTVGELLAYTLPNIVVLTIPMALLFGILIAIGRLASDSELVAMRSCGVSLFALYRPILLLSGALALINGYLTLSLLPSGNHALQQLRLEIITRTVSQQVEPRVFYSEWPGRVLYVFEVPPGGKIWHGVFLAESIPGQQNEVFVAEHGEVRLADNGEKVVLHLENAVQHTLDFNRPQRYQTSRYPKLDLVLQDQFTSSKRAQLSASRGLRELGWKDLKRAERDPSLPIEQRRLARVEMHKRFAIPAACLVFGLLALPLGFNNRRGGKSSGFALSIGVILFYYVLLNQGEESARIGKISASLAMWLPNLLLSALSIYLLVRSNRDLPVFSPAITHWPGWARLRRILRRLLYRLRSGRRKAAAPGTASIAAPASPTGTIRVAGGLVVRLPRLRLRFPNILDRYVLRVFVGVFLMVLLSGIALSVIADLSENLDDVLKNRPPAWMVFDYYKFLSLQISYDIAPIVVLVTTLIVFSLLARTNEVTACKALGVSLFRLAVPAIAASLLISALCGLLETEVLAASNQRVSQLRDRIHGRTTPRSVRRADQQWLIGEGRYVYNYLNYDPRSEALQRLQVFEFNDRYQLIARLVAASAKHTGTGWVFTDGWARSFAGFETGYQPFKGPVKVDLPEEPAYFAAEMRRPNEMTYGELVDYVRELKASGQAVPELEVSLHNKIAFPVASLVMALVGLPFSFRLERKGALYGLGVALALGMFFIGVFAFFRTLGQVGVFPPAVAVWSPAAIFSLLAAYLFLGVRS